jgi:hypothetical protein
MTEKIKDFATFTILLAVSLALAAGGILWLGTDGRVPIDMTADGEVTKSGSVLGLWLGPAFTLVLWGLGAPGVVWLSNLVKRVRESGGEDVLRGLGDYRAALRAYAVGFTLLVIGMQIFILARAAGVARPLGLDKESFARLFFVLGGLLFAYFGNISPKVPYVPTPAIDAARHYKAHRFFGLVFTLGGVAYCVVAVAAPFDQLGSVTWPIAMTMIVLPLIRYVLLTMDYRREIASRGCDPA